MSACANSAMTASRRMALYGTTSAQLGEIAVACRKHASMNPDAVMRKPIKRMHYCQRLYVLVLTLLAFIAHGTQVSAQGYPSKPIKLVVPFAPGGSTDVVGRLLAQALTRGLAQTVFVENRAGGGTNIGAEFMFGFTAGVLPHIKANKLRPLAVTSEQRLHDFPQLPTMHEAGVKDYEVSVWYGVLAPAGTSTEVVNALNSEIAKAVNELAPRFNDLGAYPLRSSPAQFAAFIKQEIVKWGPVVRRSGARID
jgi:tripartite-type tricarboxylate transporter receptor subunit TctC